MLEIGDRVILCIKRAVMGHEFSEQQAGIITEFLSFDIVSVSTEIAGRQEDVDIPVDALEAVSCSTCIHRLQKLTTNNCPATYKRRSQSKNEVDRVYDSDIFDVNNNRVSNTKRHS